jgi:hypothetical protein
MIGQTIGFLLRNLPAVLFGAALVLAAMRSTPDNTAERYFGVDSSAPDRDHWAMGRRFPCVLSGNCRSSHRMASQPFPV